MKYSVEYEADITESGWRAIAGDRLVGYTHKGYAVIVPPGAHVKEITPPFVPGYYRSLVDPHKVRYFELVRPEPGEWEHVEIKVRDNAGL